MNICIPLNKATLFHIRWMARCTSQYSTNWYAFLLPLYSRTIPDWSFVSRTTNFHLAPIYQVGPLMNSVWAFSSFCQLVIVHEAVSWGCELRAWHHAITGDTNFWATSLYNFWPAQFQSLMNNIHLMINCWSVFLNWQLGRFHNNQHIKVTWFSTVRHSASAMAL